MLQLKKWRCDLHNSGSFRPSLTDWFKLFNCITHDFLIAKLEAYGFIYEASIVCFEKLTLS